MGLKASTKMRAASVPRARLCLALLLALQAPVAMAAGVPASPDRETLMAQAWHEHDAGHRVDALARVQDVLARWPDDHDALALSVTLLTEMGATTRAKELAARLQPPQALDRRVRLDADDIAHEIRWANGEPADPKHPYAEADRAVDSARRLADDPALDAGQRQRAEFDLLVALDQAGRADEAVSRYDALHAKNIAVPAYAERAVADAMLVKRRPFDAVRLYEDSIARDPGPYDSSEAEPRLGLMYAYLESGQTAKAMKTIDELAAKEPKWTRVRGIARPLQNSRKMDADTSAAELRLYVDMPADAYARVEPLSREAPANAGIRRELGMAELARGWPRRAEDDLAIAGTLDYRSTGAYLGQAEAARALYEYEDVEENLDKARALGDRNGRVDRAVQSWNREKGWQFDISTEQGKGSSPDYGDRDGTTQATLASPLIDDHWRVLALARRSTADLPEGDVNRTRYGVGVRGYLRGFEAYIQALPSTDRYVGKTAVEAGFDWSLTDHWSWATDFSTAGEDTPLRAQYYGISAKTIDTAVTWRASELTEARLAVSRDDFSDGNKRTSWLGTVTQRLYTAPNLAFDGGVELGGSMNSQTGNPYFNPRRDNSYALTGRLQNSLGSWYEHSVTQRIDVAVGQYAERGYATDWIATVRYGQIIQARAGLRLGWGLSWHDQPYDGQREHRVVLDLTLHWGE